MKNLIKTVYFIAIAIVITTGAIFFTQFCINNGATDYIFVFILGSILSAIEMGSRYKDEPISVITCRPGLFYITINGLICCVGLALIHLYGTINIDEIKSSTKVTDILYASLGSFFVMRSSFLKLGSDNSQIDLGLNIILKKMIDMIDRQVDRDQASRRSKDITELLSGVSFEALSKRIKPFCLQVMQNVPQEEIDSLIKELITIEASDDNDETRKLAMGLELYNIVGKNVLSSVVRDLKIPKEESDQNKNKQENASDFNKHFTLILESLNNDKMKQKD